MVQSVKAVPSKVRAAERASFPVVLIGPMAAGKTRTGRAVARSLEVPFIDTDQRVSAAHGPISELFAREGEDYFRLLEREAVVEALAEVAVVSLGGGAVLSPQTQADLAHCAVVFLTASAEAVARRLSGSTRPLLPNGVEDWQRIFDERRPIYEALADIRIDTSNRPAWQIADDVLNWLKEKS